MNRNMKKIKQNLIICISVFMMLCLMGCKTKDPNTKIIGISAPSNEIQRWATETVQMKERLIEKGYEVIVQYADKDVSMQISQIENMIAKGADILIVIPIEEMEAVGEDAAGFLSWYANPGLISEEKSAWRKAALEKHGK